MKNNKEITEWLFGVYKSLCETPEKWRIQPTSSCITCCHKEIPNFVVSAGCASFSGVTEWFLMVNTIEINNSEVPHAQQWYNVMQNGYRLIQTEGVNRQLKALVESTKGYQL